MTRPTTPRRVRLGFAATSALALAVGLAPGGDVARAAFPGTNGKIICSGPLATEIADPVPQGQSRLELFTMNPDGSAETRLTTNTNSDFSPRYSPDGTKVAFVRDNQIWTMDADGSNQRGPLTTAGVNSFVGDWSPDGSKIVFQSTRDGNFEVYVMDADGSNQTNLTNNATTGRNSDSLPTWSVDGRIAFQSNRAGNPDVWVMNADGSNPVNLTAASPAEESGPRWSADGTMLAFHSDRAVYPRPGVARNLEIYRMNADGSEVTRLTFNDYDTEEGSSTLNLTGFDIFPAWSPEGDRIVFHSGRAEEYRNTGAPGTGIIAQWEVYTVDARTGEGQDGAGLVRLTNRPGNDERCDWQPIPRQLLTVALAGDGKGTVTSAPAGIDCGTDCTEAFSKDTQVTLAASPASGSAFTGFSGGECAGSGLTCTVTMSQARTVTATFGVAPAAVEQKPYFLPSPVLEEQIKRVAARLTWRVRPKRDRRKPYRFTVIGRLRHPASVRPADACQGRVTVRYKARKKTISSRRTQVKRSCRFRKSVRFTLPRRFARTKRLRVQVRFEGNKYLLPKRGGFKRVRVR